MPFTGKKILNLLSLIVSSFLVDAQYVQNGNKLIGTGEIGSSHQGDAIDISGDGTTMIVGAPVDNSAIGAAWIYIKQGHNWVQQGLKITPKSYIGAPRFGYSVSLSYDGNIAVIGACTDNNGIGAAYVFTRENGIWTQQQKLVPTGAIGKADIGASVTISADGNTIAIGGETDNNYIGAVWVFTKSNGMWSQQGAKLVGNGFIGFSQQGISISISADGNTIVEGGSHDNSSVGAVWVFGRNNGVWSQQGSKLIGSGANMLLFGDGQGESVAVSGDGSTIIEGSGEYDHGVGAVWVFTQVNGIWTEQSGKLVAAYPVGASLGQGESVDISYNGDIAVVGAEYDGQNGVGIGAVLYYSRTNGVWKLMQKISPTDPNGSSNMGEVIAISSDGNTIATGGPMDRSYGGAAWVFTKSIEFCSNSSIYFPSNILGHTYQWQVNIGAGFVDIGNNMNYSGSKTQVLKISNIPSFWSGYQYRCIVDNRMYYSNVYTLRITSYWNGTVDTKWENGANWDCGKVPDRYTDVYIQPGKIQYPQITQNGAECKSLSISPQASINVNPLKDLTIYGK